MSHPLTAPGSPAPPPVTEPSHPPEYALRCCFCNGVIPTGPAAAAPDDPGHLTSLQLEPGEGAASFLRVREQSFYCHLGCFRARLHDPDALEPFPALSDEDIGEEAILEACGELAADLFTDMENLPFRERLFASAPGRWLPVEELCAGVASAERRLAEIAGHNAEVTLFVQHAPSPLDEAGEYSLVVFYEPYYLWTAGVIHLRGA